MTRSLKCQLFTLSLLSLAVHDAHAACTFSPTAGDDSFVCDSGTAPSLIDLSGNNALVLPVNSTGSINGPVTFGVGADSITVHGGLITGVVNQGDGIDDFVMSGGQIQSLAQGDGRDTFLMTGGTIVGAFEDGDVAKMTGGSIGRVDMKLDNNIFDMSGGQIIGNLVTGFGRDSIILSGGSIGGNISVSGGEDGVTVTGGTVGGEIRLSFGNDRFVWRDAGLIKGAVLMGEDNDTALLANLSETLLSSTPALDGGLGTDSLSFENSAPETGARYINWETINLTRDSRLTLNDTLTLGDSTSGTGVFNLDASSRVESSQGVIKAFASGQNVTVNNAGLIDLTTNGTSTSDRLTIVGNYTGNGARLNLHSVLAGDNAASDALVVSSGTLSGTTSINVTNVGGTGALTAANGIQVVEANQGAVSSAGAFTLGQPLSAGAYQYYLFKGGVTAGSENSWFLRSSVVTPPAVAAVPEQPAPGQPTPQPPLQPVAPTPAAGTPPLPVAAPGESIVLYRQEVPLYAVVPPAAALLAQTTLGTFHERQGNQHLLTEKGAVPAGWVRAFGNAVRQSWSGTVAPSFDGSINGYQVGHDLYGHEQANGYRQRVGVFVSHARLDGDVRGFNLGFKDNKAGDIRLDGDSLGAYWTLISPQSAYLDVVAMGTRFDGRSRSERGARLDLDGHGVSLSVEAGYPLALSDRWQIEPQAQLIGQRVSMDSANDGISRVGFDTQDYLKGRVGARLTGAYEVANIPVEPYLRSNLWHSFGGRDATLYDGQPVTRTDHTASTVDIGAGLVARLHPAVSVYASTDYSSNIDSRNQEGLSGTLGLRVSW
ncbi:autotransporter outer membrane beta-barrel domain-containing protein [Pseudomonas lundensis]|uniref:autotransporter family protein n=1 Tax=Pseudomonas lundensis TaxID=86185 RepID=UPI001475637A|nr:autotransporter outer membrane beta-barrel domain-containing protein [Pseudomonas lundensis]NMZ99665.1 autotransporter outer membrane beta-barrel domain-containing protein [Pseudomonas lundensis]